MISPTSRYLCAPASLGEAMHHSWAGEATAPEMTYALAGRYSGLLGLDSPQGRISRTYPFRTRRPNALSTLGLMDALAIAIARLRPSTILARASARQRIPRSACARRLRTDCANPVGHPCVCAPKAQGLTYAGSGSLQPAALRRARSLGTMHAVMRLGASAPHDFHGSRSLGLARGRVTPPRSRRCVGE